MPHSPPGNHPVFLLTALRTNGDATCDFRRAFRRSGNVFDFSRHHLTNTGHRGVELARRRSDDQMSSTSVVVAESTYQEVALRRRSARWPPGPSSRVRRHNVFWVADEGQ